MARLIIILGNENEEDGTLACNAISRVVTALNLFNMEPDSCILPTGSFGDQFNVSNIPHGALLSKELIKRGVTANRILPGTQSSNTIEDAYAVRRLIETHRQYVNIELITSEFHMPRAKFIFSRVLFEQHITYVPAPDSDDDGELSKRYRNEKRSLKSLKRNWVDVGSWSTSEFPESSRTELARELRHYDNLSYLAISGAGIIFGFLLKVFSNDTSIISILLKAIIGALVILSLGYLYTRFADTAASARRTLKAIEKFYSLPGLSSSNKSRTFFRLNIGARQIIVAITWTMVVVFLSLAVVKSCTIQSDIPPNERVEATSDGRG